MFTTYEWLVQKSKAFSENTYLLDANRDISYLENFQTIQTLIANLNKIKPQDPIVFLGAGSIESYQLYFAVISLQAVWIPISFRLDLDILHLVLNKIKPTLIIYDNEANHLLKELESSFTLQALNELFNNEDENVLLNIKESKSNRLISMYLTSGSTGIPKIVKHSWHATLHHANATIERYGFKSSSRLFNPRQLFHVSGAFALITMMFCGGSIVIPATDYYKKSEQKYLYDWALLIQKKQVTHVSYFPMEMRGYAELIDKNPLLIPKNLQRITTGGEAVEFQELINISRVFATNRMWFDSIWKLYPYLGDSKAFALLKTFYEKLYGPMVQVTQTYGATELICNAFANSVLSGPDMRGVGTAINTIHPEIVDDNGFVLPNNGKTIGRLRFYGSSIASSYLDNDETVLSPHCYNTNDLASIDEFGRITFFGRSENLIHLPGIANKLNPVLLEREINKIAYVKLSIVFKLEDKIHAAIWTHELVNKSHLLHQLKNNPILTLVATISIWLKFPITLSGKLDKNAIINSVTKNEVSIVDTNDNQDNFLCNCADGISKQNNSPIRVAHQEITY